MADLLDRAKKVLFPDVPKEKPSKRRARASGQSCSLVATSDAALSNSDITAMHEKENRMPKSRGMNQRMDSLVAASSTNEQPKKGFRRRGERSSLESNKSINSRVRQTDSLASIGDHSNKQSQLENESNTSTAPSINEAKGPRRRGRITCPVSSLVQTDDASANNKAVTKAEPARKSAVSSLMNLPGSIQKSEVSKSKTIDKHEMELVRNIQSMNLNDKSNRNTTFSSPLVHKHRPFIVAGECTSPPGVLHRLSSVSSNIFQRSPNSKFSLAKTPGSANPRRKRMDKKKTPDKLTGIEECGISPIVTELAVSPKVSRRQRKNEKINNPKLQLDIENTEGENKCTVSSNCDAPDERMMSPSAGSPNVLASPLTNNPNVDDHEFICAKANLFPVGESIAVSAGTSSTLMEVSEANATRNGTIRGSAVFSVQKAPPLPKAQYVSDCAEELRQKGGQKKNKQKSKRISASTTRKTKTTTEPHESKTKPPVPRQEGTRKSARESKQTDRLTVDSWDDSGMRKVRFTNDNAFSSSDESDSDTDARSNQLLPANEKVQCNNKVSSKKSASTQEQGKTTKLSQQPPSGSEWSNEEVAILRNAQSSIDPTLANYWEEIATLVDGRSSSDCREKWFSLVATPRGRPPKENKKQQLPAPIPDVSDDVLCDDEDDIFHSTPMRNTLLEVNTDALANKLHQSSAFGSSFGLSPCIQTAVQQVPRTASLNDRRTGYKTYIDKLRKDLNPSQNSTKMLLHNKALKGCSTTHLDSGDWGKVLADGSVKLSIHEESEDEIDDFFDDEDEE